MQSGLWSRASRTIAASFSKPQASQILCRRWATEQYRLRTSLGIGSLVDRGNLINCEGGRRRLISMATKGKFPPQKQDTQPGDEHQMEPQPRAQRPSYRPTEKLKDKVAIITGGDSGIGRAVAYLYALEGASVAITYLPPNEEKDAEDTLKMVREAKQPYAKDPVKIGADLGYDENCKNVVDQIVQAFGRVDILVNNAAVQYPTTKFEDIPPEQVERVFRTNAFSYFFMTRHALRHMKEGSSIINTASVNAYKGNSTLIDYTSTKGANVAFTRALALHLADRNIRVNGVAPGPVWTPLIPSSVKDPKDVEGFGEQVPLKRAAQPDEIAPSYVFLASDIDSSYFTGQFLHPNGGYIVNA
ncbi:hypothetical protein O6H91_06G093600 [Diphasiastrum complanatum]|uniref:Uncharacterized protein n=1 Tax=Diphasiastrum complanatum TaxID=34168 RepID=A0ACC2DGB1_DIPCM|nr:hypothetical protein O6H91_06G093600 [Diphasiastrum complanatum]